MTDKNNGYLMLMLLPNMSVSRTLHRDPQRAMERIDKELPRAAIMMTEQDPLNRAVFRTEMDEPEFRR